MLEPLVKLCIPLPKNNCINVQEELRTIDEVEEEYFPGFKAFIDSSEQEIPRPKNKRRKEELLLWQKEETYYQDTIYGKR